MSLDEVVMPALLRGARGTYAAAMRASLTDVGCTDIPRDGAFVLGGMAGPGGLADRGATGQEMVSGLAITKEDARQLIVALVTRGYLTRETTPDDGGRATFVLTERGHTAAGACRAAIEAVDTELATLLSPEQISGLRAGLAALGEVKGRIKREPSPPVAGPAHLSRFCPIFWVRDLGVALRHYEALGFTVSPYDNSDYYGFADRDGTGIHLATVHTHDHEHDHDHGDGEDHDHGDGESHDHSMAPSATYLYVSDADALYAEWTRPGIGGHTHPVSDTEYGLREGAHIDVDDNLIRFGSPLPGRRASEAG